MGAASATNYKRRAWACGKIMYPEKSNYSMNDFKCLQEPENSEMVMILINAWRDHEKAEILKDLSDDTCSRMFFTQLCGLWSHLSVDLAKPNL